MIALVRRLIFRFTSTGSIRKLVGSMSAKMGTAPNLVTALAVAKKV